MSTACHYQQKLVDYTKLLHKKHSTYIIRPSAAVVLSLCLAAASSATVHVNGDLARRPSDRAGCTAKAAVRRTSPTAVLARLPIGSLVGAKALAGVVCAFRVIASHEGLVGFHLRSGRCERMRCQSEGGHDGNGRDMHDRDGIFLLSRRQWQSVRCCCKLISGE